MKHRQQKATSGEARPNWQLRATSSTGRDKNRDISPFNPHSRTRHTQSNMLTGTMTQYLTTTSLIRTCRINGHHAAGSNDATFLRPTHTPHTCKQGTARHGTASCLRLCAAHPMRGCDVVHGLLSLQPFSHGYVPPDPQSVPMERSRCVPGGEIEGYCVFRSSVVIVSPPWHHDSNLARCRCRLERHTLPSGICGSFSVCVTLAKVLVQAMWRAACGWCRQPVAMGW